MPEEALADFQKVVQLNPNLALGWSPDPLATFSEWHRVLGEGGLLVFSTWGPDTLREVREACERLFERRAFAPDDVQRAA